MIIRLHIRRIALFIAAACSQLSGPMIAPAFGASSPGSGYGSIVETALREFHVPGAAVAIYTPSQRWIRTFGLADVSSGRKVDSRDYFAIRSVTKSFAVTAVLQLVAQSNGSVTLDDVIGKYVPNVPDGDIITIRELAGMTSGLFNYVSDQDFIRKFQKNLLRHWDVDELLNYAFHSSKHPAVVFTPGTQYQYSNTNTLVLGKLVETLSGQKFETFLEHSILAPLGLNSTFYLKDGGLPHPAVTGYQDFFDDNPAAISANPSALSYSGAMAATIEDLATWGTALADGSLLPPELQRQRLIARKTAGDPSSPLYDRYGLGMGEVSGWWGHTGTGIGFQAAVFHQIADNQTIAILLNASNASDVPVHIFCRLLPLLAGSESETDPQQIGSRKTSVCDGERR